MIPAHGTIRVIDSHTAGEPTRLVVEGGPDLGKGSMAERLANMRANADWLRTSLVTEPRGCEWMVGGILLPPVSPRATAGVVFFNNSGYLGMCGHGLIGVTASLAYLKRIRAGTHRFETPVGDVLVELAEDGNVSLENVVSYRHRRDVVVSGPGIGEVVGDVAWGGNWFFISSRDALLEMTEIDSLLEFTHKIRDALNAQGVTGKSGAPIDHIEIVSPPSDSAKAAARNFVLCPGGQYDRSPCGTGTSAKLACLAADGKLAEGQVWRQESIVGTTFEARYRQADGGVVPTITGRAFVNGDLRLIMNPADPFRFGIPSPLSA